MQFYLCIGIAGKITWNTVRLLHTWFCDVNVYIDTKQMSSFCCRNGVGFARWDEIGLRVAYYGQSFVEYIWSTKL